MAERHSSTGPEIDEPTESILDNGAARNVFFRVGSILSFFVLWALLSAFSPRVPGVVETLQETLRLYTSGEFFEEFFATIFRVLASFLVALTGAVAIGIIMGRTKAGEQIFETYIIIGLTVPSLAIAMISLIVLGLNNVAAIVAIFFTIVPLMTENMWEGTKNLNEDLLDMATVFEMSQYDVLFEVILPQLYPYILAATRFGLSLAWKIVVIVEFLGLGSGIGKQIQRAFSLFDLLGVIAWTLSFVVVMFILEFVVIKSIEQYVMRWRISE